MKKKRNIYKITEFIRCGDLEEFKRWLNEQSEDFICVRIMHTTQHEIDELKKKKQIKGK